MGKFPFYVNIDFNQDTTGILEQIATVKTKFRELENEVKKLDTLINTTGIEMKVTNNKKPL